MAYLSVISKSNWDQVRKHILAIEENSFPPSIRDSTASLKKIAYSPTAIFLTLNLDPEGDILGYLTADRLEKFPDIPGLKEDRHFKLGDTIYISSVAVSSPWRNKGLGKKLQIECFQRAFDSGYNRITAHIRKGAAFKIDKHAKILSSHPNWYQTGITFDYVEFLHHMD